MKPTPGLRGSGNEKASNNHSDYWCRSRRLIRTAVMKSAANAHASAIAAHTASWTANPAAGKSAPVMTSPSNPPRSSPPVRASQFTHSFHLLPGSRAILASRSPRRGKALVARSQRIHASREETPRNRGHPRSDLRKRQDSRTHAGRWSRRGRRGLFGRPQGNFCGVAHNGERLRRRRQEVAVRATVVPHATVGRERF
jgi:hypothetical protein